MPPQLGKNHVVPTAWQDEALGLKPIGFQEETKLIGYQEAQPHSKLEYAPLALLGGTAKLGGKGFAWVFHRNGEELGTIIQSSLGLCAERISPRD